MNRRLRQLEPAELNQEQRALYAELTGGPRGQGRQAFSLTDEAGRLEGPFNAMLLSPALGGALQALGARVRYSAGLSDRAREIAILTVGYGWHSAFEAFAHERVARALGMTEAEFAAIREGQFAQFDDPAERTAAALAHALVARGDLDDEEYGEGIRSLGEAGLFELTTLVGYYATLALQLRVFRVPAPEN